MPTAAAPQHGVIAGLQQPQARPSSNSGPRSVWRLSHSGDSGKSPLDAAGDRGYGPTFTAVPEALQMSGNTTPLETVSIETTGSVVDSSRVLLSGESWPDSTS